MAALFYLILGKILGILAMKYLGAARTQKIIETAGKILGDPNNPITDTRKAMEQAVIADRFDEMTKGITELERLQREGAIEAQAAEQRGRDNAPPPENVQIVPVDGTEPASSPWQEPPK
jgi:hypothetical protein